MTGIKMIVFTLVVLTLVKLSNQQTVDQLIEGYIQVVDTVKPECIALSGADPYVIDQELKNSKFAEDKVTKCFWGCVYNKLHLITSTNQVLKTNIRKYIGIFDKDAADEIFQKCTAFKGPDFCETATGISRCVYRSSRALLENH